MKNSAKDAVCVTAACVNARRRKCTNKGTTMDWKGVANV